MNLGGSEKEAEEQILDLGINTNVSAADEKCIKSRSLGNEH